MCPPVLAVHPVLYYRLTRRLLLSSLTQTACSRPWRTRSSRSTSTVPFLWLSGDVHGSLLNHAHTYIVTLMRQKATADTSKQASYTMGSYTLMNTESVSRWCLSTIVNGATQILMASDTCSAWLVDAAGRANEVVFRDAFKRVVNVSFRKYDMALASPTTPPMSEAEAAPVIA